MLTVNEQAISITVTAMPKTLACNHKTEPVASFINQSLVLGANAWHWRGRRQATTAAPLL